MKKTQLPLKGIAVYFILHGVCYMVSYFIATQYTLWESQWNFLLGNSSLFTISVILPILLGIAYIATGIGLLRTENYARILLLLLCVQAIFFEFPIGTILSLAILIYSFLPAFSKLFPSKTVSLSYKISGILVIAISIMGIFAITGFSSNLVSFTSHKIVGYEVAALDLTPENKIEGIEQRIGILDVLIELTDPDPEYASQQQDILIANISGNINRVLQQFTVINAITVNLEASNLLTIAENENVKRITPVEPSAMIFPYTILEAETQTTAIPSQLNVDELWEQGYTGENIVVAVMDTGIKKSLFTRDGVNIVIDSFSVSGEEYVASHGTMVTSCVLSIAPDADIIDVNVFEHDDFGQTTATTNSILQGFEYVRDWRQQTGRYVILSCSWGVSPTSWADSTVVAIAASTLAVKYDIPVIAAAGNSGQTAMVPNQIMSPSGGTSVLSVGAVDSDNVIADFSSKGPYINGLDKPDVVANGVNVPVTDVTGRTVLASGTSFSCPFTSGIGALLAQDNDVLPEQLYTALEQGATDLGEQDYDTTYGYGLVNAKNSFLLSGASISEFDSTLLLSSFAVVGFIILLYPSINRRLQK